MEDTSCDTTLRPCQTDRCSTSTLRDRTNLIQADPATKQAIRQSDSHGHVALAAPEQWHKLTTLWRNLADLEGTAEQLSCLLQQRNGHQQQQQAQQQQTEQQHATSSSSGNSRNLVQDLQQQLVALQAEMQRVEADRQEMAVKQGNYKGTIAQLEGALSFTERKVKDQLGIIDKLQAQIASLTGELQEAKGAAAQTPDRCRTAARVLQAEADRAASHARSNEAQVRKLKHIVRFGARELSELLDFAEQERLTLVEKEQSLQQQISQTRERLIAAETNASDASTKAAALQQQLETAQAELAGCHTRILELEELLASTGGQLQQSEHHIQQLAAEQDAVKRNLLTAEAELHDVGEYSTKMFRQVRFISHMLDKNSSALNKLPDFASLSRDLRAFVAANASNWERRDTDLSKIRAGSVSHGSITNC